MLLDSHANDNRLELQPPDIGPCEAKFNMESGKNPVGVGSDLDLIFPI